MKHQTLRRAGLGVAALSLSALMITGCASAATPDEADAEAESSLPTGLEPQPLEERTTVTINAAGRAETFSIVFMAAEMGEFEKENLDIVFTQIPTQDAIAGLGQDQIQMLAVGPNANMFNAIDSGVDIRFVFPGFYNNTGEDGLWASNEVAKEGASALRGQQVASCCGPGSSIMLVIDDYLQSGGVDVTEIEMVSYPLADVATALTQGAINAAYLTSPGTVAVREGGNHQQVQGIPKDGGSAIAAYLFGPGLLEKNPEVGQAVIRAMARTVINHMQGDYKAEPGMVEHVANALERTVAEVEATPSIEFDPKLQFREDLYDRLQNIWIKIGGIVDYDQPMKADEFIDTRFIEAALK